MIFTRLKSAVLTVLMLLLLCTPVMACTIFCFTHNGKTYFCNNEDWRDPITEIRFTPAKDGNYAWVYFGFANDWSQGGVNEHGLCYDWVAGGGPFDWKTDAEKLDFRGNLSEELLRKCRNVDEAIEFYKKYNESALDAGVTFIADKDGNSILVHWKDGKLVLQKSKALFHSCGVGKAAVDLRLDSLKEKDFSVALLADALNAGSSTGEYATKYSNIISLSEGKITVFQNRNYDEYLEIDFREKLLEPASTHRIADLFSEGSVEPGVELKKVPRGSDYIQVKQAVGFYLNGGTNNDFETLKKAFHKTALIQHIGNDGLQTGNAIEFFRTRTKPGPKKNRTTRVVSIDVSGNAATAKLEIDYPTFTFVDYMTLLKIDGDWKIVSKVYERRAQVNTPPRKSLAQAVLDATAKSGVDAAVTLFEKSKGSKEYKLDEAEMNRAGYKLLQAGKVHDAIELFKLNVSAFPDSWNVHDSLGEAYAKNGNTQLAIASYESSIRLNPENSAGIKILNKLKNPDSANDKQPPEQDKIESEQGGKDQHSSDAEQIKTTLTDYIEGSTNGQPDRLKSAFHPDLNLYYIKGEQLKIWSGTDYIKDTKEGQPTGENGKILSIDFENDIAVAKVEISTPQKSSSYIDYFLLLKADGNWTIIHKAFTRKTNDTAAGSIQLSADENSAHHSSFAQKAPSEIEQEIDAIFEEQDHPDRPGVAIAVMQQGEVVFQKGYGAANLEHRIPFDPSNTVFNIASTSKQFTGFAILLLAEKNKLSLDDDIRKHVPELPDFGKTITLRQLANHTSGIRSHLNLLSMAGWKSSDEITRSHVLRIILRQKELNFEPGDEFEYSNSGYVLLAEVVARVSGQSFERFCYESILQPLKMNDSFFNHFYRRAIRNVASSYGSSRSPHGEYFRQISNDTYSGPTGLFTTAADLAKWTLNFRQLTVGSRKIVDEMNELGVLNNGDTFGYGLGQFVEEYKGLKHIQHGGATAGLRTYLGRFPDQDFAVLLLGNSSAIHAREKALEVADVFLKKHYKNTPSNESASVRQSDDAANKLSIEQYNQFHGNYWNNKDRSVRIHTNNDGLVYSIGGGPTISLTPVNKTELQMQNVGRDVRVQFRTDDKDESTMHVIADGKETNTFEKYDPKRYSTNELQQYVGRFYSDELDTTYMLDVENGQLMVRHIRFGSIAMIPIVVDSFTNTAGRFSTLKFERNSEQEIDGFRIGSIRVRNLRFTKLAETNVYTSLKRSLGRAVQYVAIEEGAKAALKFFDTVKGSDEYYFVESEMNDAGYALIEAEKTKVAIEIFKLNVAAFPKSWNAYDSLGEAYVKDGNTQLAIENYEHSIQLNPDSTAGTELLKKLETSLGSGDAERSTPHRDDLEQGDQSFANHTRPVVQDFKNNPFKPNPPTALIQPKLKSQMKASKKRSLLCAAY